MKKHILTIFYLLLFSTFAAAQAKKVNGIGLRLDSNVVNSSVLVDGSGRPYINSNDTTTKIATKKNLSDSATALRTLANTKINYTDTTAMVATKRSANDFGATQTISATGTTTTPALQLTGNFASATGWAGSRPAFYIKQTGVSVLPTWKAYSTAVGILVNSSMPDTANFLTFRKEGNNNPIYNVAVGGAVTTQASMEVGATNKYKFTGRSQISSPSDGVVLVTNAAGTSDGTIKVANLVTTGTAGAGYLKLGSQSSKPTGDVNTTMLYARSGGYFSWLNGTDTYFRSIRWPTITGDRELRLPDTSGTAALVDYPNNFSVGQIISANGGINTPSINLTGTPYAGTTANSYPLLFLNNTGANPTTATWSAGGTYFGIMGANGFGGNYIDIHPYNSSTQTFRLDANGNLTINGNHYAAGRLSVGTTGTSNAAIGSYLTSLTLSTSFSTSGVGIRQDACTYNSSASANTSGAHVAVNSFAIPTLTATNSQTTATAASTIYIAGAPVASTNLGTATNLYALYVNSGTTRFGTGSASVNTAPIKIPTGTLNTTAEAGAIEYNNNLYATKNSGLRYGVGGSIFSSTTATDNSSTTETDLHTYTTPASTLADNGSSISFEFGGTTAANANAKTLKAYFAGTEIIRLTTSTGADSWSIRVVIVRASSTSVIVKAYGTVGIAAQTKTQTLTGLTLSSTNIIKVTGTGGATSDISALLSTGEYLPAPQN